MKIGVRAHDYGKMEIEDLAAKLHDEGYDAAQLSMPKAIAGIDSFDDIRPHHLERVRYAFEKYHIEIPVFGCYVDLGNPDRQIREDAVRTLKMCLAYSKEAGAKMVGTETAYPHLGREEKTIWYPYMLDSIKRVMEEAVRLDVKFALEPVYWHPLDSIEAVLDVMEQVNDEKHLRMIWDLSNLLESPETTDQRDFWGRWILSTGKYTDVMHIKDFRVSDDGEHVQTNLGEGIIDYSEASKWLHESRPDMYLLREGMDPAFSQEEIRFMRNL